MSRVVLFITVFSCMFSGFAWAETSALEQLKAETQVTTNMKPQSLEAEASEETSGENADSSAAESNAEETFSDLKTNKSTTKLGVDDKSLNEALTEAEIPVLTKVPEKSKVGDSSLQRMVLSLAVILVVAGLLMWATRRWSKEKNPIGSQAKIQILTQFKMGPKRSLAIVHVAGESMLIGVTDHSINLIKSLSLIDDELPQDLPQKFDTELDMDADPRELSQYEEESFAFGSVKDVVKTKMKGMRSI